MSSIQALGQSEEEAEQAHGTATLSIERGVLRVFLRWNGFPMEQGDRSQDLDLPLVEAHELSVADDVVRVPLVVVVRQEGTHVVEQPRKVEEVPVGVGEVVEAACTRGVEELDGQVRDRPGVRFVEVGRPAQLDGAPLPYALLSWPLANDG